MKDGGGSGKYLWIGDDDGVVDGFGGKLELVGV